MRSARFLLLACLVACIGSKLVWRWWENQEYATRSGTYLPWFWSFGRQTDPVMDGNRELLERALSQGAPAVKNLIPWPVSDSTNILLITVESFRADAIDSVGTPFLDSLRRHGISLDRHVSSANGTTYAIFSLVTGLWPTHYLDWVQHPTSDAFQRCFPKARRITGNAVSWSFWDQDKDLFHGWKDVSSRVSSLPGHPDSVFLDTVLAEIRRGQGRFVALAMLNGTHYNYTVDSSDVVCPKYSSDQFDFRHLNPSQVQQIHARYRNATHLVDRTLRRFFHKLDSTGLRRNTLVAITGDHGEEFMEMGFLTHTMLPDPPETRVPFLISWKNWNFHIQGWTSHVDAVDLMAGISAAPSAPAAQRWAFSRTYPLALTWNMVPMPANADVFGLYDETTWLMGQQTSKGLRLHRQLPNRRLGTARLKEDASLLLASQKH